MKLFISDAKNLFDLSGVELLEEGRRRRLYRYLRLEDRARCLTAGLMLRRVFGSEAVERMTFSQFEKPVLPGGSCFNLSHSGDKVVLLVDEEDVGADVEQIVPYSRKVANRVFTASEQEWLRRQATDEAFYRLWTGKEAVMKALGLGFHLPPESFEILSDSFLPNSVCGRNWYLHWFEIDGHMICTAAGHPGRPDGPYLLARNELLQKE